MVGGHTRFQVGCHRALALWCCTRHSAKCLATRLTVRACSLSGHCSRGNTNVSACGVLQAAAAIGLPGNAGWRRRRGVGNEQAPLLVLSCLAPTGDLAGIARVVLA